MTDELTKKISLETIDSNFFFNFITTKKKDIELEIKKLQTDAYSNIIDETKLKRVRLFLLEKFKTKQKSFITLFMLKILYILYINKDNQYENLNFLIFGKQNDYILIGLKKELYLDIAFAISSKKELKDTFVEKFVNLFPQNTYYFPIDVSSISSGKSNVLKIFNRFIGRFQNNASVIDKELLQKNDLVLTLNTKAIETIFESFNKLNTPIKSDLLQEQEDEEIENIYSIEEYTEKFNNIEVLLKINDLETTNDIDERTYIPQETIELSNIFTLLNKYGELSFNFLLSPFTKKFNFLTTTSKEIITRTKLKIVQKEFMTQNEYESVVSKIGYKCPNCEEKAIINPNDLGTTIYHVCDTFNNIKTKINTNIITPEIQTPIVLYKCEICTNYDEVIETDKKEKWQSNFYIYSFKDDILPGVYIGDVVKFYQTFNILKKTDNRAFNYVLLGFKREKIKYSEENIIKNDTQILKTIQNENIDDSIKTQYTHMNEEIYKTRKLPHHKLWNILFSIRQYYKNRFDIEMNDKGLLLQLYTLISVISRICFKENKIAINVMGVGSVSKTFPTNRILSMFDLNYKYISDSTRLTAPALTGGINSAAIINGQQTRKFEQGLISNKGAIVLDECQSIFLKPEIQSILKSIPQENYQVSVMGGHNVEFNATPMFLSNFNEFMKRYESKIIDAFIIKYKSTYKFENERTLKTNQDIIKYITKINLYQNIEYYFEVLQNEILANVVYAVRKGYENERIDWKTGSQLEAMNRILFDVVIHRKTAQLEIEIDQGLIDRENIEDINLSENLPIQQVVEETLKFIYNVDNVDDINIINLQTRSQNDFEIKQQLKKLEDSVYNFLTKEKLGIHISKFFKENVDNFDNKIKLLVIKTIMMLQLIDDISATQLSNNVKKLSTIILLKCKRGVSQDEYDMKLNITKINVYPTLNADFLIDLEDTKTEMYYEKKKSQELERMEKEMKEKYGLEEKKIDTDNSLDSIEIEEPNKEYSFKEICEKYCPEKLEEDAKEYVRKLKRDNIIYEPRNGIYKVYYGGING